MSEHRIDPRPISAMHLVQAPRALRVFTVLLACVLLGALIALWIVPWQQNVTGVGRVVAFDPFDRIQTIAAPVDGRVRQAWVIEGSRVAEGDPVLEIVDNDPSILQRLEDQRTALRAQLGAAQEKIAVYDAQVRALASARDMAIDAAESQLRVARATVQSARHGYEAAEAARDQAQLNYVRHKDLVAEGLASTLEFEVAEREVRQARARLEQARQALDAAIHDEEARRADRGRVETEANARIEAARGSRQSAAVEVPALQERLSALEGRIAQQTTQLITAPRDGTVFRLFASPGAELVKAGDPLVQLIPDTESRAVELWVDGNDVPLIEPGRPVRLQFEGWPAVQFSGWPSVAVGTFGGRVALVDQSDDGQGRFRLLVAPDEDDAPWPESQYLRQGVRTHGFVLLDRVRLGYEIWRQANGFPPTVAMKDPAAAGGKNGARFN